ncbi:hypothetical protein evm_015481 [Chilo suppressalis]|nr:hypothetical protein evm_015481 [Chilo suppressalis]
MSIKQPLTKQHLHSNYDLTTSVAECEESRPISKEPLARWLGQGADAEGSTPGHGAHRQAVSLSAALTTGLFDIINKTSMCQNA